MITLCRRGCYYWWDYVGAWKEKDLLLVLWQTKGNNCNRHCAVRGEGKAGIAIMT